MASPVVLELHHDHLDHLPAVVHVGVRGVGRVLVQPVRLPRLSVVLVDPLPRRVHHIQHAVGERHQRAPVVVPVLRERLVMELAYRPSRER
jgi:hypothetical protein